MIVSEILLLREAIDDLSNGRNFYERKQQSVGDYFWSTLSQDIQSLYRYGGIHQKSFGLHRMLSRRFPYAIYYDY